MDEETSRYTQGRILRLVSDHHVQKGPTFPKSLDMTLDAKGNLTETSIEEGKSKSDSKHIDLPLDVTNGLIGPALMSLPPKMTEQKFSFVAPNSKGRIIQLRVTRDRTDSFSMAGGKVKADVYRIHYEIGGVAGVIAPIVGKQPEDSFVWLTSGVPSLVREQAALYSGGPVFSMELAGATFSQSAPAAK